ncbi:hypothetical protein HAX54_003914 [Datura stramonium]|uniref:Uncharacterized protein n=1 Tax=Datura stramonium TaxID=4076 RepID=A0ABS8T7F6_DATST|nr:hypothetical protein [Datura stramonium]
MAIAVAIILPIGLLFLLSGLIINFIQALLFVLVRPFSKRIYRRINKEVTELLWLEIIWLFDWWANVKRSLYCFYTPLPEQTVQGKSLISDVPNALLPEILPDSWEVMGMSPDVTYCGKTYYV